MNFYAVTYVIMIILNGISGIACFWLFCMIFKMSHKSIGIKMIKVLGTSDFIYHISNLWFLLANPDLYFEQNYGPIQSFSEILFRILHTSLHYSLFWAAIMALIIFKAFSTKSAWNLELISEKYFFFLILICLIPSLL